jgi:hypothetical protein
MLICLFNLLKPTGYYTYHQVQHLKILHAGYIVFMCFVWLSEETVPSHLCIFNRLVFVTEVESVYCAVQTAYNMNMFRPQWVNVVKYWPQEWKEHIDGVFENW